MNTLDRIISYFSPGSALKRAQTRAAAHAILSYEAVRSERRRGGWFTQSTSGNAEIGPAIGKLRDDARDLRRNNSYGRRAVREWSKRVVGYGITPRPAAGPFAARIKARWDQWSQQCMSDRRMPFSAAERLIVSSRFTDGEVLVRLWDRRVGDGLAVPFQIQVLESDYLDTSITRGTDAGYIIQGVEFDSLGRIRGYWLFGQHPGDVLQMSARGISSRFISAEAVLHHLEIERPGDVRSVSEFCAAMAKLRDIDEYSDAEIVRKKIEACLTAFVQQPEGADGPSTGEKVTDADGNTVEKFAPGMVMYGPPGAGVELFAPSSGGNYAEHKKTELREVAVGLGIPYVLLDDNLEAVNYSSYRGGLLAYKDSIEEYRWNWLIPQVLDPIWRKFIDTLVLNGDIPEPFYEHSWDAPPFELLDRGAEAEADRAELQIGKKTWPQLIGEQGNDPEQQISEIESWRTRLESAGVTFARSTTSTEGGNNGAQAPNPAN